MTFLRMRSAVIHLLPKIYEHPFNRELYQGTLPKKIFRFYLEQDALYLQDLSRALMLTSNRFATDKYTKQFKTLSEEILDTERNLHFKYLGDTKSPGLFHCKKTPIQKIPVVSDYTQHLLRTANILPVEEAVASFIPCFWIYSDLGRKMPSMPGYNINNPYHAWIASYSNDQFTSASKSIIQMAEELADTISCPIKQNNMVSAFVKSTEYEILFWDSAYKKMEQTNGLLSQCQLKVG